MARAVQSKTAEIVEKPLYTASDAASYLGIPAPTVRAWISGRAYPRQRGQGYSPPIIQPASQSGIYRLSFNNLVELYVLRALRTQHAVKLREIRKALDYAEQRLGIRRLLTNPELKTHGGDLFIEHYGQLISLNRAGQIALKEVLKHALKRIEWEGQVPVRLYPVIPEREERRSVAIDPRVRYGSPTVRGVETRVIVSRLNAGEEVDELAEDYGLTPEEILDAAVFETALARAA